MPKSTLKRSLSYDETLTIFPFSLTEGMPVEIEGQKATMVHEYCLKPAVDRIYISGFSPMPYKTFFDEGFYINVINSDKQQMSFDVESFTFAREKGVGIITIIGKRQFETFLDEPCEKSFVNMELSKVIAGILTDKYKASFNLAKDPKVTISPPAGRSRRDVIDSLAKQYNFLWAASIYNDKDVIVLDTKGTPGANQNAFPTSFNYAALIYTPIGWFAGDQECMVQPGTRSTYEGKEMVCATMTMRVRTGLGGQVDFDFLDTSKVDHFSAEEIKKCKSIQRRMASDIDRPKNCLYLADLVKHDKFLDSGTYSEGGNSVQGIQRLYPWATEKGYGMGFPYAADDRNSLVVSPTDTTSVAIGDIGEVDTNNGKKFVIKFADGSLTYDTDTGMWEITGNGMTYKGKKLALEDHKHSVASLVCVPGGPPTGTLGPSDSNT
jgi:hypothetical protein